MSVPTFTGDTVAEPEAAPPPPSLHSIGRVTVLPRVAGDGPDGPALVQEERPRFEPEGQLGEGGLGVVVAAKDLDIGRKVAIKKIRPDRRTRSAFLRFVQEVRTVGRLDHPNIVPIHDVGRDEDGSYWFVMKYVDGETLEAILGRLKAGDRATHARWTFERRVDLFVHVLHAVQFAHDRGIVHRDLKPANVMVGEHGEVQLLDWGIARQLGVAEVPPAGEGAPPSGPASSATTTRAGQLIGTPKYMSPEQARGEAVDVRADTWALSMLFYELLTLAHPFDRLETVDAVLDAVQNAEIPHFRDLSNPHQPPVPADLGWYAFDGLDRSRRYATVREMIERLERRDDGEIPVQCMVTFQLSYLARLRRFVNERPGTAIGALAALAATVLAAGVGAVAVLLAGVLLL